jgi:predicted ribosome quality control (RQC) complex YloA/Tae2 family protein
MFSNYFTFVHSARLLHDRYNGSVIAEIYSQEKNTLCIAVYTPEPHTITISCVARKNFIIARPGLSRSKQNSVDLFPSLIDGRIESIAVSHTDRVVYLYTSQEQTVCAEMFGARGNVLLCDRSGTVVDAFLNKKELLGSNRTIDRSTGMPGIRNLLPEADVFAEALRKPEQNVLQKLKVIVPKFGATLIKESLFRTNVPDDSAALSPEQCTALYDTLRSIAGELLGNSAAVEPSVYFDGIAPEIFSLIPLRRYESLRRETYVDIFSALQKYVSYEHSSDSFTANKKRVMHWITNELERSKRTIAAVEKELGESSRAEQYERFGTLLMANLHAISKGMTSIELPDSVAGAGTVTIPIDGALSPVKNAERYFEKYKKAKSARIETEERLHTLRERRELHDVLVREIGDVTDSISLKNFLRLRNEQLKRLGYMTEKEQEELPPFKIFTVEGGFTVYAGKSSANNDTLTMKWAKPNDLWFHARGSSGSHVVLKIGSGSGNPSKKAIDQAAGIAAYYSKMKNAKNVPVAMTEKKYVRKPKGVPAGTVVIEKEKVIFVQPRLPHNEE